MIIIKESFLSCMIFNTFSHKKPIKLKLSSNTLFTISRINNGKKDNKSSLSKDYQLIQVFKIS